MSVLLLFLVLFLVMISGVPVAYALGGTGVLFGFFAYDFDLLKLLPLRIYGTMTNNYLLSVPLFIYMGIMLEKSGIAEQLLRAMTYFFGRSKGGLAYSVVIVGAILAASTGIVGATVVTMGLISLPLMLKNGYSGSFSSGTIASAGTLGQIIPPSVVLVLLGGVLNVPVGDLFRAAMLPSAILVVFYLLYVFAYAKIFPKETGALLEEDYLEFKKMPRSELAKALFLPLLLTFAVLGSIILGVATPTEAAGIGALLSVLLAFWQKGINFKILEETGIETARLSGMIFLILAGASAFGLAFRGVEGDAMLSGFLSEMNIGKYEFLIFFMLMVFLAGFFIDFIEIIFIFLPVVVPVLQKFGFDMVWIGILLCINLQTSFLTPPFGFSLFYLKGVSGESVKTKEMYVGIVPYVVMQIILLIVYAVFF